MASTALLQFLPPPKLLKFLNPTSAIQSELLIHHRFSLRKQQLTIIKCTSNPTPPPPSEPDDFPDPQPMLSQLETNFSDPQPITSQPEIEETDLQLDRPKIKKRSKFGMNLKKPKAGLVKPEPKNFEIGWKRTKEINLEKPKGYVIADFLEKLETLMDKGVFGSKELLAKTGEIVAEKAREEAEELREKGEVDERLITELDRVLKLMEMDLVMVKASVKEETLKQRVQQAKVRCRQAILVANSF